MTDATQTPRSGFRPWMIVPALGAFAVVSVFLIRLMEDPSQRDALPSVLIGKPAPEMNLPPLMEGKPGLATADLKEPGVKLLNIWASWCGPCRAEHPFLMALAEEGVTIHGINYKDELANGRQFLDQLGDPFTNVGRDERGRTGLDLGSYGVPETYVIDAKGHIVYRHVGPINPGDVGKIIRPALEKAAEAE